MIGESVNIDGFYWGNDETNPKYKLEQKDHRLGVERMNNYKRSEHYLPRYGKKIEVVDTAIYTTVSNEGDSGSMTSAINGQLDVVASETSHFLQWNIVPDVIDNNFEPLIDHIINSNESVNIDGRAGCGKSAILLVGFNSDYFFWGK